MRTSSGGSASMSFDVATMKTRLLRSAIQVSSVPSMRRDSPPSLSLPLATPFSISSIHSTHGAIASAAFSASRRLRSVSPRNLL